MGLFLSGSLFFVSGILTGYSMYYGKRSESVSDEQKKRRKPRILKEIADPLIGRVIDRGASAVRSKIMSGRIPSSAAVQRAQRYRPRHHEDSAD